MNHLLRYPEDVERLREALPALKDEPAERIASWYAEFSEEWWAAGWIRLDADKIDEFSLWLAQHV
jgi:hypothetical protein